MAAVTALILAGGQSSRMGHDKALINLGSETLPETLIQRICTVALVCTPHVYVVTPWPNRYRPLLPEAVQFIPESSRPEQAKTSPGPLVALVQALLALSSPPPEADLPIQARATLGPSSWVLALACDLPNLTAPILQTWMNDLETLTPDTQAYLPQSQGRWEPLCGFYRTQCLGSWQAYLATGGRSFQGWLAQQSVVQIPQVEMRWLANLNTPDDLERWQAG